MRSERCREYRCREELPAIRPHIASMEELESRTLASRVLDRIFAKEKPSTRTIAVLHFVDGMTYEEVAEVVGMSRPSRTPPSVRPPSPRR